MTIYEVMERKLSPQRMESLARAQSPLSQYLLYNL